MRFSRINFRLPRSLPSLVGMTAPAPILTIQCETNQVVDNIESIRNAC